MDAQTMHETDTIALSLADEADALAALIGSRICHDLVSPVGAISNGVELIGMGGSEPNGPEMQLVADSVVHASARLRFFRIAFGAAGSGQMLGRTETELVLADIYTGTRLSVSWGVADDQPRQLTKISFLLLLCLETALPRGGEVHISQAAENWRIEARAERISLENDLWSLLDGRALPDTLRPAEVQFALAPRAAARIGRKITIKPGERNIALTF